MIEMAPKINTPAKETSATTAMMIPANIPPAGGAGGAGGAGRSPTDV
jgi:hypothetical protein